MIADGHHRTETALNYYKEKKTIIIPCDDGAGIDADPGLVSVLSQAYPQNDRQLVMKEQLKRFFRMTEYGKASEDTVYDFMSGKLDADMLYIDSKDQSAIGLTISEDGKKFLQDYMPEKSMTGNS